MIHPKIILGSGSPRRAELLAQAGISFTVQVPDIDESSFPNEAPNDFVARIVRAKADAIAPKGELTILTADTIVVLGSRILGKPTDEADAEAMLESLSGQTHQVITGFCLRDGAQHRIELCATDVTFRPLTHQEICDYVATGDPMDKAGAYAIQGGAAHFVKSIHGSYTNVVGLPICEVLHALNQ